ncbi:hypothetical protein V866_000380 [Kwoniella sp. B9012]
MGELSGLSLPGDHDSKVQGQASEAIQHDLAHTLSKGRKYALLAVFSMGLFMDVVGFSVFFVMVSSTAEDLGISTAEETWIITSYGVTFASFLLFWGRVSDLYSPKLVFTFGFIGLGIANIIISFLTNPIAFFVFRAISGLCGACLVPSCYRLITSIFTKEELSFAFTVYGITGSIANSSGVVIGGALLQIPGTGQLVGWRWYFRIAAALILPAATLSFFLIPKARGENAASHSKLKRMDLLGVLLILSASLLLIVGLTLGASRGFSRPSFYVPLIISFLLYPSFFLWERRLQDGFALIPSRTWHNPNFLLWSLLALLVYGWWAAEFVAQAETYMQVHDDLPIIAGIRLLPQGITAFSMSLVLIKYPAISTKPRFAVIGGFIVSIVAYVLFILGGARVGSDYWKFTFPGSIIGSPAMQIVMNSCNVCAMMSVDPHESGVAGAILQTSFQIGSTVALSIQSGLLTVYPQSYFDIRNIRASWYFMLGWTVVWTIVFAVLYRQPKGRLSGTIASH